MAVIEKRVDSKGQTSYRVKIRLKGFPTETATFARLTDAKKWGKSTEAAMLEGRHFKNTEAKRHTLRELIERYKRDVLPTKGEWASRGQSMQLDTWAAWMPSGSKQPFGEFALADVTPALIGEYRDHLMREGRSGPTANRYLAALSHAFTVAMKEWGWLDENPMRKVTKPKENQGRLRYLDEDELKRLRHACKASANPYLYPVVMLALSTGMRRAEIMELTWDLVDLKTGRLRIEKTKNKERRMLPLQGEARTALAELGKVRRLDTAMLFPSHDNPNKPMDLRKPWEAALAEAGITSFRFHDLRHTCASYLAMHGVPLLTIAEVLGHKTLQMVKRYAHLSDQHKAEALSLLDKAMFGKSEPEGQGMQA